MKSKGCYYVYFAIGLLFILVLLNKKKREGLIEKSQSQSDCMEIGKSECIASSTCIWKTDNTCQLASISELPSNDTNTTSNPSSTSNLPNSGTYT